MNLSLQRRLDRLQEQQDRPIRQRVERIMRQLGGRLPQAEVDEIVAQHRWTPARMRQLHAEGLSAEQIRDRLLGEMEVWEGR